MDLTIKNLHIICRFIFCGKIIKKFLVKYFDFGSNFIKLVTSKRKKCIFANGTHIN